MHTDVKATEFLFLSNCGRVDLTIFIKSSCFGATVSVAVVDPTQATGGFDWCTEMVFENWAKVEKTAEKSL